MAQTLKKSYGRYFTSDATRTSFLNEEDKAIL